MMELKSPMMTGGSGEAARAAATSPLKKASLAMASEEPEGAWRWRKAMEGKVTSCRKPGWRSVKTGGVAVLDRTTNFLSD